MMKPYRPIDASAGMSTTTFDTVRISENWPHGSWTPLWQTPSSSLVALKTARAAAQLVQSRLQQFKLSQASATDWSLHIPASCADGFDIDLLKTGAVLRASFGGLEEDFPSVELAMVWVGRGLCRNYRLRMRLIGGLPREWYLEPKTSTGNPADVMACGEVGLLASFRKAMTIVRSNILAGPASPIGG